MPISQHRTANLLVRSLAASDWAALAPHLSVVDALPGTTMSEPGDSIDTVYFPETAVVSAAEPYGDGSAEVAMMGWEGMIGWPVLLGSDTAFQRVVVRLDGGTLLACPAARLLELIGRSAELGARLLAYVHALMRQFSGSVLANLSSPVDMRLARWLLMLHDRAPGDALGVTHQELAGFLGVRRASVTDTLHVLEGEHMVRCTRGRITITDRAALEGRAGHAYGDAEAAYRTLVGPFGKHARDRLGRPSRPLSLFLT